MTKYFVKMEDAAELRAAATTRFFSADRLDRGGALPYLSKTTPEVLIADLDEDDVAAMQDAGASVFNDVEFEVFQGGNTAQHWDQRRFWEPTPEVPAAPALPTGLKEVLDQIKAPEAWQTARGDGVTIAIVDTGICGKLSEFPQSKRSPVDLQSAYSGKHWSDTQGHGSMCATIAAGTDSAGGRYNGVAPDATVLSARTTLYSTDIYTIFDELRDAKAQGTIPGPLVISNSYGSYTCSPPVDLPEDHPYLEIILDAINDGITVVFAAGNNHYDVLCNHDPTQCSPTTIWGANSHEQVISVGTVNADESNQDSTTPHANSSRGPGQWSGNHPKPDCVAPTYGEVVWGCGYRPMDWWGTSGACPQVAGLAALILSIKPTLSPAEVADIIRRTCRTLSAADTCVGSGIIDCAEAVRAV